MSGIWIWRDGSAVFPASGTGKSLVLYLSGVLVTSVIEYITGFLLEKLFATKWWDYSTYRFNIHGRVCLRNSLMFGVLSVIAARVIDPVVQGNDRFAADWRVSTFTAAFAEF